MGVLLGGAGRFFQHTDGAGRLAGNGVDQENATPAPHLVHEPQHVGTAGNDVGGRAHFRLASQNPGHGGAHAVVAHQLVAQPCDEDFLHLRTRCTEQEMHGS